MRGQVRNESNNKYKLAGKKKINNNLGNNNTVRIINTLQSTIYCFMYLNLLVFLLCNLAAEVL